MSSKKTILSPTQKNFSPISADSFGQSLLSSTNAVADSSGELPVFLNCAEVAELLRVSERTLEAWRIKAMGPRYIRLGVTGSAKVLYDLQALLEWLKHQERGGRPNQLLQRRFKTATPTKRQKTTV